MAMEPSETLNPSVVVPIPVRSRIAPARLAMFSDPEVFTALATVGRSMPASTVMGPEMLLDALPRINRPSPVFVKPAVPVTALLIVRSE